LPFYKEFENTLISHTSFSSAYQEYYKIICDIDKILEKEDSLDFHPEFTNLKPDFRGTLDYIFYEGKKMKMSEIMEIDYGLYLD
jgi:mRNA deadenylase 3'-5' endonuclease subunit Ccr4